MSAERRVTEERVRELAAGNRGLPARTEDVQALATELLAYRKAAREFLAELDKDEDMLFTPAAADAYVALRALVNGGAQ